MRLTLTSAMLIALLSIGSAAAQQNPPPSTPPSTPPQQPTPTQPSTRGETPTGQTRESRQQEMQRPIYVTGKVVLDDGTPLPNGVKVEMLLNGQVRRQDYTRVDGSFYFELGGQQAFLSDASVSGSQDDPFGGSGSFGRASRNTSPMGRVDLSGWEVRALLPGYQSEVIMLQNRSALDNPDIGLIVMRPIGGVKATTISLASMKAPKKARQSYESALKAINKKKPDTEKATKELNKAIEVYPEYAAAWELMGQVRLENKDTAGAREAFQKAIAADANFLNPYLSLADMEIQDQKWEQAAQLTGQLLDLNPHVARGHFLNAIANFQLGKYDVAETSIRKVQSSNEARQFPITHYVLGAILANKGDLKSAASEFSIFLKDQPDHRYAAQVKEKLAEWQQQGVVANAPAPATPQK